MTAVDMAKAQGQQAVYDLLERFDSACNITEEKETEQVCD